MYLPDVMTQTLMPMTTPCYKDCQYRVWYIGEEKCDSCTRKDAKPCTRPRDTSDYVNEFYSNVEETLGWQLDG